MTVYITKRHMEGGTNHEHIARVNREDRSDSNTGDSSRADMVKWIEEAGDARVALTDPRSWR